MERRSPGSPIPGRSTKLTPVQLNAMLRNFRASVSADRGGQDGHGPPGGAKLEPVDRTRGSKRETKKSKLDDSPFFVYT